MTHAPSTAAPSVAASRASLLAALDANAALARHLAEAERELSQRRADAQAALLATHALERQWRARQADAETALAAFAPQSLYQALAAAVAEQEAVCAAMEESFLDGGGATGSGPGGVSGGGGSVGVGAPEDAGNGGDDARGGTQASEREASEWVRRYREAKTLYYLRQERKERWDEGRVGGWR